MPITATQTQFAVQQEMNRDEKSAFITPCKNTSNTLIKLYLSNVLQEYHLKDSLVEIDLKIIIS